MVRTRYAPSPTGFMHVGNLRTALYEYLIAKHDNGSFVLRIEDTDQERFVEGAAEFVYSTLRVAGLQHDEGPDIGGAYGPYVQSERKSGYLDFAKELVAKGKAYYCFCSKERLDGLQQADTKDIAKYDRHCLHLTQAEIDDKLAQQTPYVIRQLIPEGQTTIHDEVYGDITVSNDELDDQILIKSDGMPTYNFANVVDDHLMEITHVIRGSEYLSSAPKYNLLYESFGWPLPVYIHLPLILNQSGQKLAKRRGDANFEDLLQMGYLSEAVVNFIALLGWSPADNREFFTLPELVEHFDIKGLSKSPSIFDMQKLTWMNGEYIKKLPAETFYEMVLPHLQQCIKRTDIDLKKVSEMVQSRVSLPKDAAELVDFIDALPGYDKALYTHKKMKTTDEIALTSLEKALPVLEATDPWTNDHLYQTLLSLVREMGIKNSQMLWPVRTALSGKPTSPCGATELAELLGKSDTLARIKAGIEKLK